MSARKHLVSASRICIAGLVIAVAASLASGQAHALSGPPPGGSSSVATPGSTPPYSARALADRAERDLLSGHPGRAILELERARLLAPRSDVLAADLAKARAAAGLPATQPSVVRRLEARLSPNEWAWLGIVGLCGVAAAGIGFASGVRGRRKLGGLLAGGALLSVLGFAAAAELAPPAGRAVVVASDAIARIGPFAQADPAFSAPEGSELDIERTFRDYVLVAGPAGRGWVPRHDVETILPAAGQRL